MNVPANREARRVTPKSVDVRGCSIFRGRLSPQSYADPVVCRLSPTTHIYVVHANGRIEKRIPKIVSNGFEDLIAYWYADSSGELHSLGEYKFTVVQRYSSGNRAAEGHSQIIDLRTVAPHWQSGTLQYGFSLQTTRPFIGDIALASFLGAMLEVGYEDIVCTGFSTEEGKTAGGSSSHVNGTNGDLRYLRNDGIYGPLHIALANGQPELLDEVRQTAFIEALYRFGWKSMLSYRYQRNGESRLLKRTRHYSNHHHHLHLQGYSPNLEEIHE